MFLRRSLHKCKDVVERAMKKSTWSFTLSVLLFCVTTGLFAFYDLWPPICILSWTSILVWKFPNFVPSLHRRPIYLDDLRNGGGIKEHLYSAFHSLVNISFVLLFSICVIYAYMMYNDEIRQMSLLQMIATLGGTLSFWSKGQQLIGRMILLICYQLQKRRLATQESRPDQSLEDYIFPLQVEYQRRLDDGASQSDETDGPHHHDNDYV